MNAASALRLASLSRRAHAARREGIAYRIPGMEFDAFGRRLSWRLMASGQVRLGLPLLLNPVSIVRYWEFPFVMRALPASAHQCLDVSSPMLFLLYFAWANRQSRIDAMNPDGRDLALLQRSTHALGLTNVTTRSGGVDELVQLRDAYDCIWSISVVEHIHGSYDDRAAMTWMYQALKPGGTLVLTFPVDRCHRKEFREDDCYGLQAGFKERDGYFFQRWYDPRSIQERLLAPIGNPPHRLSFFGELERGTYAAYEKRWKQQGLRCSVDDPKEIARHYGAFERWDDMPGIGVCGLRIVKPGGSRG